MNISGKVTLVTGGASGLGEATVRAYVKKGAKVAIFIAENDYLNAECIRLDGGIRMQPR